VIAIKVLNLDTEEDDVDDIQKEIALLSQLTHAKSQNITPYYGSFLNDTKLWIIMEYAAGGSVRSIVRNFFFCNQDDGEDLKALYL
jgi:serine/threonine protein kinase